MRTPTIPEIVMALADAPVDSRTGNRVLYSANWIADASSMIGKPNEDWIRRELNWFRSGSNRLIDMEGPVPKLFQACAGDDPHGRVNSAYGYVLFGEGEFLPPVPSLYNRVVETFLAEGPGTRHAVAIISDRDIHYISKYNGRNDFICTNALNFMIDDDNRLHIIAQMRSMDAVFGYRADYSMWDDLMKTLIMDLNEGAFGLSPIPVTRGHITFQVANLHVYPRHFDKLAEAAEEYSEQLNRRVFGA